MAWQGEPPQPVLLVRGSMALWLQLPAVVLVQVAGSMLPLEPVALRRLSRAVYVQVSLSAACVSLTHMSVPYNIHCCMTRLPTSLLPGAIA